MHLFRGFAVRRQVLVLKIESKTEYGALPKRLKGTDSKSVRAVMPPPGFKSLMLRAKILHATSMGDFCAVLKGI